ncbi:glutamate receptor 2.8-like isoform X2 [Prosopis cineraria]|uniref:glutamate receptor 2.8-like isoform X2 n=1 Tax=Prosopis cineraria TaxID=364024 RepID=UPI002410A3B7|nr:glutamate receptor 2.8-like isoform X2 [Prosopis cineraria]
MKAMKRIVVGFFAMWWVTRWSSLAMGTNTMKFPVGVIVDEGTWIGKLGLSCIHMALSDFYASHSHYNTRIHLTIKHTDAHMIAAASAVAQNEATQVAAITAIVQAFGWNQVVLIYEEGLYGEEVIPHIMKTLQDANVHVPYQIAISPSTTDQQIIKELANLRMMSNRVFIIHMPPILGLRVFTKARDIGMISQGYVWIMTTSMTNLLDWTNSSITDLMQGVVGVASYFPKSKEVQDFEVQWKLKFQKENPNIIGAQLNVLGLWAYDAATALAIAVEKARITKLSFQRKNVSKSCNTTDFETIRVSQSGSKLQDALSKTAFKGLSGKFNLVNGEMNSKTFQIININGDGKKVVGFWTPHNGLERELSPKNMSKYSTSKANLKQIIWPGDSPIAPKGWDVGANGKRLKVGIQVKRGFFESFNIHHDSVNDTMTFNGYCIDIFIAVMRALPYSVPFEFIPFNIPNLDRDYLRPGVFYDDLIQKVYVGEIDAVVGDLTIMFERSQYVDFTLPFTEGGVNFLVPTKQKNKEKAWLFLKPLTWELWLATGCFFVFISFVVWVLEHQNNEEFRGSPSNQIGNSFWFSFLTMDFAQREKIHSNLARVVVIIWAFVVLILTQSYTASFTTLLTVQQLQPTVIDINQLIRSRESIGYQLGSYTYNILKQIGFDESRLRSYNSPQQCDHLLTIGSQHGGIVAAFDKIPYLKAMETSYCSKYTMIGPTYNHPGFGFAFRRNSPLVNDVSRAILNLTEKNEGGMKEIENAWFENASHCKWQSDVEATYSLNIDSFRGLFLIAVLASSLALVVHIAMFLIDSWKHLNCFDPSDPFFKRICVMVKVFYHHYNTNTPFLAAPQTTTHQVP